MRMYYVYLLADADNRPLYVGVTCQPKQRWATHRREKWWRAQIKNRYVLGAFWSRRDALDAETRVCRALQPVYNIDKKDLRPSRHYPVIIDTLLDAGRPLTANEIERRVPGVASVRAALDRMLRRGDLVAEAEPCAVGKYGFRYVYRLPGLERGAA